MASLQAALQLARQPPRNRPSNQKSKRANVDTINPWLLTGFLAHIHSVGVAMLTSKAALIIAGFLNLEFLHPLECGFTAVRKCLEARCYNKPGAVGSIGIDDHRPFTRTIITASQQKKNQG
jgi:hypothetical protein